MAARSVWPYRLNGSRSFSLSALCSSVSFLLSFVLAFPARGFSWSKLLFFVVVSSSLARLRFPAPSSEVDVDARGALSIDRNADWSIAETRWPGQLEERRAAAVVSSDSKAVKSVEYPSRIWLSHISSYINMPTSLLDLPDELLMQICDLFALDKDGKRDLAATACEGLGSNDRKDRHVLLSLCLTSKRLRAAAHSVLHRVVQPSHFLARYLKKKYYERLLAADLTTTHSLVIPVSTGDELVRLKGLSALHQLHLCFIESLMPLACSQLFRQLSTRSNIVYLSLYLAGVSDQRPFVCRVLRMVVTYLQHVQHLYIDGFPRGFSRNTLEKPVSTSPPQLATLRVTQNNRERLQAEVAAHFLPCFLMDENSARFSRTDLKLVWERSVEQGRVQI